MESLWVRIKNKTGKEDETLYRQTGTASPLQALVLTGDFNDPSINWKDNTAGHKYSRRFWHESRTALGISCTNGKISRGLPPPNFTVMAAEGFWSQCIQGFKIGTVRSKLFWRWLQQQQSVLSTLMTTQLSCKFPNSLKHSQYFTLSISILYVQVWTWIGGTGMCMQTSMESDLWLLLVRRET